jgi:N-acetylneuraminic acid mutarotase
VTLSSGSTLSLQVGATSLITATARDAQGNALAGRTIAWNSSAASVASVSATGLVTAHTPGTAQIRATSEGKFGEVMVTVRAAAWTSTGSMATGRTLHSATLLANGKVLVVGGQTLGAPFQTFATAELYDPVTGAWTATGSMSSGRENHIAVRLTNGKVLVAGGYSVEQQAQLRSAELYDPATGTWSATGNLVTARELATPVILTDGRVLVVGGVERGSNPAPTNTAEIYDPATGAWSPAGVLSANRGGHTATLLGNGTVLVAGGTTGPFTNPVLHASAELYDPATGMWSATGSFGTARAYHQAVALANGRALIVGGSNVVSTTYAATDVYDPGTGLWAGVPSLTTARISHTATRLSTGRVLVTGGIGNSGVLRSVEIFDPATESWSAGADLTVPRANHPAVLLADGRVLVVGGQGVGAAASAEIFDPAAASGATARTSSGVRPCPAIAFTAWAGWCSVRGRRFPIGFPLQGERRVRENPRARTSFTAGQRRRLTGTLAPLRSRSIRCPAVVRRAAST